MHAFLQCVDSWGEMNKGNFQTLDEYFQKEIPVFNPFIEMFEEKISNNY